MSGYEGEPNFDDLLSLPFNEYMAIYIRHDAEFMAGIRRGLKELKEGKIRPWEEIRRELGLARPQRGSECGKVGKDDGAERAMVVLVRKKRRTRRNWRKATHCHWCGCRLAEDYGPRQRTRDHLVPRSVRRGLQNNLVAACYRCNQVRGTARDWKSFGAKRRETNGG